MADSEADGESRDSRVTQQTLTFYRQTLEWPSQHHQAWASRTQHDLADDERHNAVWKLVVRRLLTHVRLLSC